VCKLKQGEETMTLKAERAQYTLEFKLEAVRLVKNGQSLAAVSATLGVVQQTLHNWVKADRVGKLGRGAPSLAGPLFVSQRLAAPLLFTNTGARSRTGLRSAPVSKQPCAKR
jgi:transposase